jgi:hypothetical protein
MVRSRKAYRMDDRFTSAVLRVLREAGWFEGRRVDTVVTEAFLQDWGLPLLPAATAILHEFDGLKCEVKDRRTCTWFHFGVLESLMFFSRWQAPAFAWITGQPLCPVGHGNGCVWFVAESGEVVSLNDEWLGYVRQPSLSFALDNLFGADYDRTTWIYFDEQELDRLLLRLKPSDA